jgi:maleylpyruvate isomerase
MYYFSFKVPTLITPDGTKITQSVAILEYLEETHSTGQSLLPKEPKERAKVGIFVELIPML